MKPRFAVMLALWPMVLPVALGAQDGVLQVAAPVELVESGLMRHLLPRFALKHGLRAELVGAEAEVVFGDTGTPVFQGLGRTWHLEHDPTPEAGKFTAWLGSTVGRNALESFAPEGSALFTADIPPPVAVVLAPATGDTSNGEALSVLHCGRCHVVNAATRMTSIGSTPSFGALRNREDWQVLFGSFYLLNPHPSFTQIETVTPPFDISRPSPIYPVYLTLPEVEAILAFVAGIPPADLGAPLTLQ